MKQATQQSWRSFVASSAMVAAVGLAACGPQGDSPAPADQDPAHRAWMSTQGTQLEGAGLAAPVTATLVGVYMPDGVHTYSSVTLTHGSLVGLYNGQKYSGSQLVGSRFKASLDGSSFWLIIRSARPHTNLLDPLDPLASQEYEYGISAGEADLCRGSPVAPYALAQPGIWTTDGAHSTSTRQFTMACQGGVLAKCSDFGYKPYVDQSGATLAGKSDAVTGENLHYVCTRMARADYCTNGTSHTVDGTHIDMFDILKFRTEDGVLPFEAAWDHAGQVICLAKKRWETIPLGGLGCPNVADPRLAMNKGAAFCDNLLPVTAPTLEAEGALLYNDSAYIDAGLYLWSNGTDFYTSSRYADWGAMGAHQPQAGYFTVPQAKLGFQGAVYNPTNKPPAGTVALMTYVSPGSDYYTTTGTPPAGYSPVATEGYIFPATVTPPAGAVSLYSYVGPSGDHATTTDPASLPAGYQLVALEGYLPR